MIYVVCQEDKWGSWEHWYFRNEANAIAKMRELFEETPYAEEEEFNEEGYDFLHICVEKFED